MQEGRNGRELILEDEALRSGTGRRSWGKTESRFSISLKLRLDSTRDDDRTDRNHPAGASLEGQSLRRDHRAFEVGRLPRAPGQRPPVRSDDRRPHSLPRRVHAAVRHRCPGAGRPLSPGRDGTGRLRRARPRGRAGPGGDSGPWATEAAGWRSPSRRAGSTSATSWTWST